MFVIEGINDLKTLSDVIGGELHSNNESFTGITTDSREEVNGAVYLALKGESFDAVSYTHLTLPTILLV